MTVQHTAGFTRATLVVSQSREGVFVTVLNLRIVETPVAVQTTSFSVLNSIKIKY